MTPTGCGHHHAWIFFESPRPAISLGLLFVALLLAPAASAQYHIESWTTDQGLPQNSVLSITQTRDGYLWFTTFDGLTRFDGVRFTVFDKGRSPGITSNRFLKVTETGDGSLWASTESAALVRFKDGRFRSLTAKDGWPGAGIINLQTEPDGGLIISAMQKIMRWHDETLWPFPEQGEHPESSSVHAGRSGYLWVVDEKGLHQFKGGAETSFLPAAKFKGLRFAAAFAPIYEDSQGALWLASYLGAFARFKNGVFQVYDWNKWGKKGGVNVFLEDRDGYLWLGLSEEGLARFKVSDGDNLTPDKIAFYSTAEGLSGNIVKSLYQDREGALWAGTDNRGLNRLTRKAISTLSSRDGLVNDNVYPILQAADGTIWIGSTDGLTKLQNGRLTAYRGPLVQALYQDRQGRLLVGAANGLYLFDHDKFINYGAQLGADQLFSIVCAIEQTPDGAIWVGTGGLIKLVGNTLTVFTDKDGLPANDVRVIHQARDGSLWIGTSAGLAHFKDGRFTTYTQAQGLPTSDYIRTIYEEADGTLWIGTYDGGLLRRKDGRFTVYDTTVGLYNNGVFQIFEDARGNFWMGCNRGIYRVSKQQLNDFADGKIKRIESVVYGKQDGMLNIECNGARQPAGLKARDGKFWFPTQEGVAVVDPEAVSVNRLPPPVLIEQVSLDRAPMEARQKIEIAPGWHSLEIQYTALSFIRSDQIKFRYQLAGLDRDWVEAGTQRQVFYSSLPPGSYKFSVMAANSDGVWNTESASLEIVIRPPFWRTWWFSSLLVLSVIALALLGYRRRVSQFEHAQAAQEEFSRRLIASQEGERKRIAAELHDSLGQSLAIIKNRALLGIDSPLDAESAKEQFEMIAAQSAQAMDEAKEISYNLRPYLLDRLGLRMALQAMIKKVADSSGIAFTAEIGEIDGLLPGEQEINLYRIVQECVNNIVKHAHATQAQVVIKRESRAIELRVSDQGQGFVTEVTEVNEQARRGFGLVGIAERARLLGGAPSIQSAPGKGTRVTVKIPTGIRRVVL